MKKIAIITAEWGYTKKLLHDPNIVHNNVDYIAFVDKLYPCRVWKQIIANDFTFDEKYKGRRNAKIYKILPHLFLPEYEYFFWVDTTHEVVENPENIINLYLKNNDIAVFKHNTRNCAYQEAEEIKRLKYDDLDNVNRQIEFYEKEIFPKEFGLFELPVSVRKNTNKICTFNLKWWEQICRFSSRDQISFPYCLWKSNIQPIILPGFANGINPNSEKAEHMNELIPQVRS